jgi:TfoX/Sxy family transcriptional regulator of competence genes
VATSKETIAFILDQLDPLNVRARAMFGEYGLYCDEKIVALVCDDTLFVKPSAAGEQFLSEDEMSPPYPHAKNHYGVPGERLDDREWLQSFIQQTADLMPAPKPKKPKAKKSKPKAT